MVMAFVILMVPERVLNVPTHGTIQYHPSLLPRHRGPSAINWAIIQGDATTGVSIFWPDDGLDTGPLLLTKEVEITPDDTLGSLYFDKLYPIGVDALIEGVDLVRDGKAPRREQNDDDATYESWCGHDQVEVDWSKPVREVHDLIRGANPRPGAWTTVEGDEVQVLDADRLDDDPGAAPGEVVEVDGDRLVVAAGGGAIAVRLVRADGDKLEAGEYARARASRRGRGSASDPSDSRAFWPSAGGGRFRPLNERPRPGSPARSRPLAFRGATAWRRSAADRSAGPCTRPGR